MIYEQDMPDHSIVGDSETTVYLLHGLYGSKEYWKFVSRHLLKRGYRVVAWDAPGYGDSPELREFTLMEAARIFARFMARTSTKRNILFGQSMGSQIALRANALVPGLVSRIIVCASIGYFASRTAEEQEEFVEKRRQVEMDADPVSRHRKVIRDMMAPGAAGIDVDLVLQFGSWSSARTVQHGLEAIRTAPEEDALAAYAFVNTPALFVAGELDKVGHPKGMQKASERVKGSNFVTVPGCGHYPWAEQPDEFWRKVDPFLDEMDRSFLEA